MIGGAWLIRRTGQPLIDPLIAFLIAGLILWTSLGIIVDSTNILLESLPKGMKLEKVAAAMLSVPGVREVHTSTFGTWVRNRARSPAAFEFSTCRLRKANASGSA